MWRKLLVCSTGRHNPAEHNYSGWRSWCLGEWAFGACTKVKIRNSHRKALMWRTECGTKPEDLDPLDISLPLPKKVRLSRNPLHNMRGNESVFFNIAIRFSIMHGKHSELEIG